MGNKNPLPTERIQTLQYPECDLSGYRIECKGIFSYESQQKISVFVKQKQLHNTQKGLKSTIDIEFTDPYIQVHQIQQKAYIHFSKESESIGIQFLVENAINDRHYVDHYMYLGRYGGQKVSFILKSFQNVDCQFGRQVFQDIGVFQIVNQMPDNDYLMKIKEYFCIQSSQPIYGTENCKVTQVAIFQPVVTNLAEIIDHRRSQKQEWTYPQFLKLLTELIHILNALHNAKISHGDLRLSNVFYSEQKQSYLLYPGSSMVVHQKNQKRQPRQSSYSGKLFKLSSMGGDDDNNVCQFSGDVYCLGKIFMKAFYLSNRAERKACAPINRKLIGKYPFLELIREMLRPSQKRPTIGQLSQKFTHLLSPLSQIIHNPFLIPPVTQTLLLKRQIATAYKLLGNIDKWKYILQQSQKKYHLSEDLRIGVKYYEQLGVIHEYLGSQKSKGFFKKSNSIYQQLAQSSLQEDNYEKAISYYTKSIENCIRIGFGVDNCIYLRSLVGLHYVKVVAGIYLVPIGVLEELDTLILNCKFKDLDKIVQCYNCLVGIYSYYEFYQKVIELLLRLKVILTQTYHMGYLVKNLKDISKGYIKLAQTTSLQQQKQEYCKQAFSYLSEIKETYGDEMIGNFFELIQLDFLKGEIQFVRGNSILALASFEDSLIKLKQYEVNVKQGDEKFINIKKLKGYVYEIIGNIKLTSDSQSLEALIHFQESLKNYQKFYGFIYSLQTALILEKISVIHKNLGNNQIFEEAIVLSKKIMKTMFGVVHKQILRIRHTFFKRSTILKQPKSRRNSDVINISKETTENFTFEEKIERKKSIELSIQASQLMNIFNHMQSEQQTFEKKPLQFEYQQNELQISNISIFKQKDTRNSQQYSEILTNGVLFRNFNQSIKEEAQSQKKLNVQ